MSVLHQPLVSVVILCYNHAPYLDECMAGLLNQRYRNIELILFDDGSTDGSWEKICGYEAALRSAFPTVICNRHDNAGFFKGLDLGIRRAEGEFLCILESDDYYYPAKIEENLAYLQAHPDVGVVHSDTDYRYGDRIEQKHWATIGRAVPTGQVLRELLVSNFVMTCSMCCRTEFIRKWVDFKRYESRGYLMADYPLCLDLAKRTRFGYIDKSLACYRVLKDSASHSTDPAKQFRFWKSGLQIKLDYLQEHDVTEDKPAPLLTPLLFHRKLFRLAYELGLRNDCLEEHRWLLRYGSSEDRSVLNHVRAISVHNRMLWRMVCWLEGTGIVHKVGRRFKPLFKDFSVPITISFEWGRKPHTRADGGLENGTPDTSSLPRRKLAGTLTRWKYRAIFSVKKQNPTRWVKDILVMRRGGIGDVLMTTPAIRGLRSFAPHARIVVETDYPELFDLNPYVAHAARNITPERFDIYLTMSYEEWYPLREHITDIFCRCAGVPPQGRTLDLFFSVQERQVLRERLSVLQKPFITIQPRAGYWTRNKDWLPERWEQVVDIVRQEDGLDVIQLGEPNELLIAGAIDWRGKTTLREAALAIQAALLHVGCNSAGEQFAHAVGTPAVVLYGITHPVISSYPEQIALYGGTSAIPCYHREPCDHPSPMEAISVEDVVHAIRLHLGKGKNRNVPVFQT